MSSTWTTRLKRISEVLTPERIELLERRVREVQIEQRVESWTANQEDFVTLLEPDVDDFCAELVEEAVGYWTRRLQHGAPDSSEWRVMFLAGQVVAHAPGTEEHEAARSVIEQYAAEPSANEKLVYAHNYADPWTSSWFDANLVLAALGEDHGLSLHHAALPAVEDASKKWAAERAELADRIASGTAKRLEFMFWTDPDRTERRQLLLEEAARRRHAREAGAPLDLEDVYDYAADLVSHPYEEGEEDRHLWVLRAAREQIPTPGSPAHQEWVEANELHWVVGPDGGRRLRAQLAEEWDKEHAPDARDEVF